MDCPPLLHHKCPKANLESHSPLAIGTSCHDSKAPAPCSLSTRPQSLENSLSSSNETVRQIEFRAARKAAAAFEQSVCFKDCYLRSKDVLEMGSKQRLMTCLLREARDSLV